MIFNFLPCLMCVSENCAWFCGAWRPQFQRRWLHLTGYHLRMSIYWKLDCSFNNQCRRPQTSHGCWRLHIPVTIFYINFFLEIYAILDLYYQCFCWNVTSLEHLWVLTKKTILKETAKVAGLEHNQKLAIDVSLPLLQVCILLLNEWINEGQVYFFLLFCY